jgi:twitching motility protein PilT
VGGILPPPRTVTLTGAVRVRLTDDRMPGYDNELAEIVAELNRAASGSRASHTGAPESTASLDQLLAYAVQRNASDLLLIAGAPVALRVDGELSPAAGPALGADDTRNLLLRS